jgi:hypothetical protein
LSIESVSGSGGDGTGRTAMELLFGIAVAIGVLIVAGFLLGALLWVLAVVGVIAVIAWFISSITGLPFWGVFVAVVVIGGIGWALTNLFD